MRRRGGKRLSSTLFLCLAKLLEMSSLGFPLPASVKNKGRSMGSCGKGCQELLSSFVPVSQVPGSKADAFVPGKLYAVVTGFLFLGCQIRSTGL